MILHQPVSTIPLLCAVHTKVWEMRPMNACGEYSLVETVFKAADSELR